MSSNAAVTAINSEHTGSVSGIDAGVLSEIYDPAINLVRWRRHLNLPVRSYLETLRRSPPLLQSLQGVMATNNIRDWLTTRLPAHCGQAALVADIVELSDMFSLLFDLEKVGLRLTLLEDSMCPRFHVDHVPCRLLTTYTGAATEWLPNTFVDRSRLGTGNRGLADSQSGLYHSSRHIHRMETGDVALLKGESWLGNEGNGLVHRSPASGKGELRLLLSIDFS